MKRLRNRQLTRSRVLLFVVGVTLTAVGVLGLLLTADRVTQVTNWFDRRAPLLNSNLDQSLADHRLTYQLVALAVAVVCIVVGFWWLRSQIPPIRHHQDNEFPNNAADVAGRNVVAGGALAAAMEDRPRTASGDRPRTRRAETGRQAHPDTSLHRGHTSCPGARAHRDRSRDTTRRDGRRAAS